MICRKQKLFADIIRISNKSDRKSENHKTTECGDESGRHKLTRIDGPVAHEWTQYGGSAYKSHVFHIFDKTIDLLVKQT